MDNSLLFKSITWNGGQWLCEDLTICVKMETEKGLLPIDIDPKGISIIATPDCMVMGTPQLGFDKKWVVPVKIKDGFSIAPEGMVSADSIGEIVIPGCRIGRPVAESLPKKHIDVQLEVTVKFVPPGLGAAMGAAGMIPGGAAIMDQVIPPIILKSNVVYRVEPPRVSWTLSDGYAPVRLSGEGMSEEIIISGQLLPPGWEKSAVVEFALTDKSRQLQLELSADALDSTSAMSYALQIAAKQLCMIPVQELAHNENICNAKIELLAIIRSEHLGVQVSTLFIDAQALDICLYFANKPAAVYEWSDKNKIIVIPMDKKAGSVPKSCRLPVELRYLKDWPLPDIRWELGENLVMNDKFTASEGTKSEYNAPDTESWNTAGKPEIRTFWCRVGKGTGNQPMEIEGNEGLYTYLPLEADLYLTDQLRKARIKVRLGPADLLKNNQSLDLSNQDIMQSLIRETEIEVEYL